MAPWGKRMNSNIYNNLSLTKHNIRSSLWIIDPPMTWNSESKKKVGDSTGWETSTNFMETKWVKKNITEPPCQAAFIKTPSPPGSRGSTENGHIRLSLRGYNTGRYVKVKFGFSSEKWIDCLPTEKNEKKKKQLIVLLLLPLLTHMMLPPELVWRYSMLKGNPGNSPFGNSHAFFFQSQNKPSGTPLGKKTSTTTINFNNRMLKIWTMCVALFHWKTHRFKDVFSGRVGGTIFAAVPFFK